nr:putative capsid protein [Crucivirus sp.]
MPYKKRAPAKKSARQTPKAPVRRRPKYNQGRSGAKGMSSNYNAPVVAQSLAPGFGAAHVARIPLHREFLFDVNMATAFATSQIPINAALAFAFPWGATLASNYEKYRFRYLSFVYVPTSATSVGSTNTAQGTVLLTFVPNAVAPPFTNKQQQEAYEGTVVGAPYAKLICRVDLTKINHPTNAFYTRSGSVPSGQDQRLFDVGVLNVSVVGAQAASISGEIHVVYAMDLITPRAQAGKGGNFVASDHFIATAANVSASALMGTGPSVSTQTSNLGGVMASAAAGTLTGNLNYYVFNPEVSEGIFLWMYQVKGASTALTNAMGVTLGTNLSAFAMFDNSVNNQVHATAGETAVRQWVVAICYFNGANAANQSFIQIGSGTVPGTITSADFLITQINPQQLTMTMREENIEVKKLRRLAELTGLDLSAWDEKKAVARVQADRPQTSLGRVLTRGVPRSSAVQISESKHESDDEEDDERDRKIKMLEKLAQSTDLNIKQSAEKQLLKLACESDEDEKDADSPVVLGPSAYTTSYVLPGPGQPSYTMAKDEMKVHPSTPAKASKK